MGNKVVVFPELVSQLSETTSTSEALCESFLKSFFVLASEQLEQGNRIEIKHIGVFYVGSEGVAFEASEEIKSSVNAAFDCFEPIELDEDYDGEECGEEYIDEDLLSNDQIEDVAEDLSIEEGGQVEEVGEIVDGRAESSEELQGKEFYNEPGGREDQHEGGAEVSSGGAEISESDIFPVSEEEGSESDENTASTNVWRFPFVMGFLSGVAIMLISVFVLWYMGFVLLVSDRHEQSFVNAEEKVVLTDNVTEGPSEEPSGVEQERPVTELAVEKQSNLGTYKVTKTAYLSNISRKYYGHYVFWVYIYLENKDLIKDPDNLPVGVELTIPSPEKYGIDKDDEKSVKKAELKAIEVKNGRI